MGFENFGNIFRKHSYMLHRIQSSISLTWGQLLAIQLCMVYDNLQQWHKFLNLCFLICRMGTECLLLGFIEKASRDNVFESPLLSRNSLPACRIVTTTICMHACTFVRMHVCIDWCSGKHSELGTRDTMSYCQLYSL